MSSVITAVLNRARADIGMVENPPGSNRTPNVEWYNANVDKIGVGPWCAMSTTKWYWLGGAKAIVPGRAYVPWIVQDYLNGRLGGKWTWGAKGIQPGDAVIFDWQRRGRRSAWDGDHIGIVERVLADGTFLTIEGNFGNRCQRLHRDDKYVLGYGRPDWAKVTPKVTKPKPVSSTPKPAPAPRYAYPLPAGFWFGKDDGKPRSVSGAYNRRFEGKTDNQWVKLFGSQLAKRGWSVGAGKTWLKHAGNNGIFGDEYVALIKRFQKSQGLPQTGRLDKRTWDAAFLRPVT